MRTLCRLALGATLLVAAACSDSSGPDPVPTTLRFKQSNYSIEEGETLDLAPEVTVLDEKGRVLSGLTLTWSSSNPAAGSVDASGRLAALASGDVKVGASVGPKGTTLSGFTTVSVRGVPTTLQQAGGDAQRAVAGATLRTPLAVRVLDRRGTIIVGAEVSFATTGGGSVVPATATTDFSGTARATWTLGPTPGEQTLEARAARVADPVVLSATAVAPADMPQVERISPDTLRPGATITLSGRNFTGSLAGDTLLVAGLRVALASASPTELTATLPGAETFPCVPTGPVEVMVRTGGLEASRAQPVSVARRRALAVGEVLTMTPAEARCNEFAATGGRYVVSVFNTSQVPGQTAMFRIRGTGGSAAQASANLARQAAVAPALRAPLGPEPEALARERRERAAHEQMLRRDHEILRAARIEARAAPRRRPSLSRQNAVAAPEVAVGDTLRLKVSGTSSVSTVTARVVYVGPKAVVLEDKKAPLAGTMDDDYRAFGEEFEKNMLPIVEANFGNPLAVDQYLGAPGKVLMLFTPRVNDRQNVLGFVTSCDMLPDLSDCAPSSNRAAIFYGMVPTVAGEGTERGTRKDWFWQMRPTVIHEVKHIASNAEHLVPYLSGQANDIWIEDLWLEEASAMISEEIWARGIFGYRQNGNTGYAESIYCEVRALGANWPDCSGKPSVMTSHFAFLYDYLSGVEHLSPFVTWDDGGRGDGAHFYGSGWLFLRWAADNSGMREADFFRALNMEKQLDGIDNVVARMGRPFPELMAEWSLALVLDDYRPAAAFGARYSIPSWNVRDVYAGLSKDFPTYFPGGYPLAVNAFGFGAFEKSTAVRGGSAAYFELSGTQNGPQALELSSAGGLAGPTLRMSVVRVE